MRHCAVTAQVAIPVHVLRIDAKFTHTRIKNIQTLFTL
ncbi:Uncharacterised protein [Vibrio cholerae]|nr:Uncharacterised protein [Vibrio cholerae]CSI43515.1 Uncharacterised protein [Vibrio cholerae]